MTFYAPKPPLLPSDVARMRSSTVRARTSLDIRRVPLSQVVPWEKNPRGIRPQDLERLKRQIQKLGVYKPLVCCEEKGRFIVLGGNMRIRALQELGVQTVEISVVEAKTEAKKLEYALSDNDRAGYYEEAQLAELASLHIAELDFSDFKVDIGNTIDLKQLMERFGPNLEPKEQDLDETLETTHECPKCGYKW